MSLTPRQVVTLAQDLAGKSERVVDQALKAQHLSPEERISVKHAISAAVVQRQIDAQALATDTAEYDYRPQPTNETQRLLVRAGFRLGQHYEAADVDRLLQESGFDATQRIACRVEMAELGMTASTHEEPRHLTGKSMRASADTQPIGRVLRNADGSPRTLCFA